MTHRNVLAPLFAALLASAAAVAEPGEPSRPAAETAAYRSVPVTLWLAPVVGLGAAPGGRVIAHIALSLGVSGYARLEGVDLGVGASWVDEAVRGLQITTFLNYAGADLRGAQISAGANIAGEGARGVQLAAGVNYAGADLRGAQVAAAANVTRGEVAGLQLSSGFNYGPDVRGAQIGLVNVGGQVTGAQIGLINIGRDVKGTQLGLVNIAEASSAPVGLINLVENGQQHIDVWASDAAEVNFGLKLGSEHVYSVLAAGFQTTGATQRWLAGLGLGGHLPLGEAAFAEADLLLWHINEGLTWTSTTNELISLRLVGGVSVHRNLSFFAGPTLNVLVTDVGPTEKFGLVGGTRLSAIGSARTALLWPGFVAGVQL